MSNIPFLYINVTVLCCFALMFVTILAVKKTPEIWAFLAVLLDVILWAGGSVFMRLQVWPGMRFWYTVSLTALFIMELLFYIFIHVFTRRKGKLLLTVFLVWNAAILPGTISGFFLKMPRRVVEENGDVVFLYDLNWHIIIPCIMFVWHHCRNGGGAAAGHPGAGRPFPRYPDAGGQRPCDAGGQPAAGGHSGEHLSL